MPSVIKSFLAQAGFIIRDRDGVRIVKDRNCFGHPDTVLAKVDPGFALLIPFEAHNLSVRTFRAYVKRGEPVAPSPPPPIGFETRDNDSVPTVQRGLIDETRIQAGIRRAERALAPDVVRIMFSLTPDWTGEQSLFFRILISDEASDPDHLLEITQHIRAEVLRAVKAEDLGLQTYFNFRSKSEQDTLRDPVWDAS
jgi:hypothetical protein